MQRATSKAALEAARQKDHAWRDRRQARARRLLGALAAAYAMGSRGLMGLGLLMGIGLVGGSVLFMLSLFTGAGHLVPLGTLLVNVAILGIMVLIVMGAVGWLVWAGCDYWLRSWARREAIDLPGNTQETRRRRAR